jgi:hypothetical protein
MPSSPLVIPNPPALPQDAVFSFHNIIPNPPAMSQDVDSESKIAEAISTCPVDCIYWVDYEDLATLEKERSGLDNGIMVTIAPTRP